MMPEFSPVLHIFCLASLSDWPVIRHLGTNVMIFHVAIGIASANLRSKLRLQQAISEQNVIIVTRLLFCSRRKNRKKNKYEKHKDLRKAGFTLVEIMIVVAIIGLLAAIAIPNFVKARATSQANACINNLRQIDAAAQRIRAGKRQKDR